MDEPTTEINSWSEQGLPKTNPAAIPSNDLLMSKNPANNPILVNCTNEVIETESKLQV